MLTQLQKEVQTIIGLFDFAPFKQTSKNEMPMLNHISATIWRAKLNSGAHANCSRKKGGDDWTINNSPTGEISSKFPREESTRNY